MPSQNKIYTYVCGEIVNIFNIQYFSKERVLLFKKLFETQCCGKILKLCIRIRT